MRSHDPILAETRKFSNVWMHARRLFLGSGRSKLASLWLSKAKQQPIVLGASNTLIFQPIQEHHVTLLPQLRPARLGFGVGLGFGVSGLPVISGHRGVAWEASGSTEVADQAGRAARRR